MPANVRRKSKPHVCVTPVEIHKLNWTKQIIGNNLILTVTAIRVRNVSFCYADKTLPWKVCSNSLSRGRWWLDIPFQTMEFNNNVRTHFHMSWKRFCQGICDDPCYLNKSLTLKRLGLWRHKSTMFLFQFTRVNF